MMFKLPKPSHGFDWVQLPGGPALVCERLSGHARHLFTSRSWQLGTASNGNDPGAWREVASALEVDAVNLARLRQVHGSTVVTRRRGEAPGDAGLQPEADIVISDDPGIALAVQTADCVPLVIVDPARRAAAAVHAGWRGLAARAPQAAVERMARDLGSRVEDLIAAIGPAIGACCYEVGPDVRVKFERASFSPGHLGRWFSSSPVPSAANPPMPSLSPVGKDGHWFFDASQAARDQLEAAGVPAAQIFASGLCTASHPGVFCSYRRDGAPAGRMAAAVRLAGTG